MDTNRILADLHAERDRIHQAISAIEAVNSIGRRRVGRPPKVERKPHRRGRMNTRLSIAVSNGCNAACSSGLRPSAFSGFMLRTLQPRNRSP